MPSYTRPQQAIRDLVDPGDVAGAENHYLFRKNLAESSFPHLSREDRPLYYYIGGPVGSKLVLAVYTVEDLWDEILSRARTALQSTWEDEVETLGTELRLKREISGSRRTAEITWLEEGLGLITNPTFLFNLDDIRYGFELAIEFYEGGGEKVGDLRDLMVRCLLADQKLKLRTWFQRKPATIRQLMPAGAFSKAVGENM
ncbi:hypothetical protein V8F20_004742 [Naviculisporaceae sp. PSN 640]